MIDISICILLLGKLQDPARMYGEVFVNGVKSCMPYGSYVSDQLVAHFLHIKSVQDSESYTL